jgi:hypothetical protein
MVLVILLLIAGFINLNNSKAIIIAAISVVAPKAPSLTISEFKIKQFNIPPYCPSPTSETCCSFGNCQLTLSDISKFNITFDVNFLRKISHYSTGWFKHSKHKYCRTSLF